MVEQTQLWNVFMSFSVVCVSEQQMLEEREQQLQAQQQKCDAAKERLDELVKTFSTVRAGVEHLADKLQHITPVNNTLTIMTACGLTVGLTKVDLYRGLPYF